MLGGVLGGKLRKEVFLVVVPMGGVRGGEKGEEKAGKGELIFGLKGGGVEMVLGLKGRVVEGEVKGGVGGGKSGRG